MDIDKKTLILIVCCAIILWCVSESNTTETFNDFALPVNWKQIAENQCKFLKDEIKKINVLLESCDGINDNNVNVAINNRLVCRDAKTMSIYTDKEKQLWCDSAMGKESKDAEFMNTQGKPDNININDNKLVYNNLTNNNISDMSINELEDEKYKNFNSIGITGYSKEIDNQYALI